MSSTVNSASNRTTHHLHHEWGGDERASERIVRAIAECENETLRELPPLSNSIRPEALDTAFESEGGNTCKTGCITFSYYGYTVLVQSTGQILIKEN